MKISFLRQTAACILLAFGFNAHAAVRYVNVNSTNPTSPYTEWAIAATAIQDAVDVAVTGDAILVTNGVYQIGGRILGGLTNRVLVTSAIAISSINGPAVTTIEGYRVPGTTNGDSAVRCVSLFNGATLAGFTLTNGGTRTSVFDARDGGGVWCQSTSDVVSNCVFVGNSAAYEGGGSRSGTIVDCIFIGNTASYAGGGARSGRLNRCLFLTNSAGMFGGAARSSTLNDCTLIGNTASYGGGTHQGTLADCKLSFNSASHGGGASLGTLNNCVLNTNSASVRGGGSYNGTVNNTTLLGNSASFEGGGAYGGMLTNSTLATNSAGVGGGVSMGILSGCRLNGNSASVGGGALDAALVFCTLYGNSATDRGGGANECILNNCTLNENTARIEGGGAYRGTLTNCLLVGNSSRGGFGGGGTYYADLRNCVLIGNTSSNHGGGAFAGTLDNCTLTGNSALSTGGGATASGLNNCILYYNTASSNANYTYTGTLNYCCTTPLPTNGTGNITNTPLFVNLPAGNLRLQPGSPCINSGRNGYAPGDVDLDGSPRIVGSTVDMGPYEFQSPQSVISYAWLQRYGLPTDGSVDYLEMDDDGLVNWQEWRSGTNPTNELSVLRLLTPSASPPDLVVRWESVNDRTYFIERGTNFGTRPFFLLLSSNILGQSGVTTYTDTNAVRSGPFFYRVGIQD